MCFVLPAVSEGILQAPSEKSAVFSTGEKITYDIKKLKIDVGDAVLEFRGAVAMDGREALLVVMTAQGFKFYDEEKIYLDPVSFFPLKIERNINIFGNPEKIVELYDTRIGKVKIVKTVKGEATEQIIERGGRFDNIYGFIYRYRRRGQFKEGEQLQLHLPMRDVTFELVKKDEFKTAGKKYNAYYMSSVPGKYKVCFDEGAQKIPLMIGGAIGFGKTSMVMKEFTP